MLRSGGSIAKGEHAKLWVDARRLHLFDPENGLSLAADGGDATTKPRRRGRMTARAE